ncbi:MAG: BON domain-containing protein [Terracidiphilus sp.]|nr:BON domain-containing protein [Terracidiphilus sp.]
MWKRIAVRAAMWAGVAAVCSAVALAQSAIQDTAQAGAARTDGQIEMDVVHALDASQALKADLITAATIQGRVTLSGTVSSDDSKRLAESIVKGVPGVTGVDDNLKVGNPAEDPNAISGNPADEAAAQMAESQPAQQGQSADQQPQYAQSAPQQDAQPQTYPNTQQPQYNEQPQYNNQPPYAQNAPAYPQPTTPPPPPPGYYNQRQGYGQTPPPGPSYQYATQPVTVPQGTLLQVRTNEAVDSKHAQEGQPVQFTVIQDVTFGGVLAIPRGATVHGVLTGVKNVGSGTLTGHAELALQLTALDLGGQSYPIQSDQFQVKSPGKGERTAGNIVTGTLLGALIGGAAGGGSGAAIGAVAGGTVGTAASAASGGPNAWIPAEALVSFHLMMPETVSPVGQQEAMRLAQGLYPGGPTLYRRSYYGGPYGRPTPYPYYYAPVYYRPYFMVGGSYYWR